MNNDWGCYSSLQAHPAFPMKDLLLSEAVMAQEDSVWRNGGKSLLFPELTLALTAWISLRTHPSPCSMRNSWQPLKRPVPLDLSDLEAQCPEAAFLKNGWALEVPRVASIRVKLNAVIFQERMLCLIWVLESDDDPLGRIWVSLMPREPPNSLSINSSWLPNFFPFVIFQDKDEPVHDQLHGNF